MSNTRFVHIEENKELGPNEAEIGSDIYFLSAVKTLLDDVSSKICQPCNSPEKKPDELINYDNPLACSCRCAKVDPVLKHCTDMLKTLTPRK